MVGLFGVIALACGPIPLATLPGAVRLAEMANGEVLVGTDQGALWAVSSFGDTRSVDPGGGVGITQLVGDPDGRFTVLYTDGRVASGGLWSPVTMLHDRGSFLLRDCETTHVWTANQAGTETSAVALGRSCDEVIRGTRKGTIDGMPASASALTRVSAVGRGVLWVDELGGAGCLSCGVETPSIPVADAITVHLAPLVPGELVWLDEGGGLWTSAGE